MNIIRKCIKNFILKWSAGFNKYRHRLHTFFGWLYVTVALIGMITCLCWSILNYDPTIKVVEPCELQFPVELLSDTNEATIPIY